MPLETRMFRRRQIIVGMTATAAVVATSAFAEDVSEEIIVFEGKIDGGKRRELTLAEIKALPSASLVTRTPWYDGAKKFEGVLARELMKYVGAKGETLGIKAFDGYSINVPMSDLLQIDAIMAYRIDNKDLTIETRGLLFLIYPFDSNPSLASESYYARCIWQISKINVK